MLTKIEMQYMDAVIGIHREMRKANERVIDWEQRRFEIAKDVMSGLLPFVHEEEDETEWMASRAVNYADALIAELKKEPKK